MTGELTEEREGVERRRAAVREREPRRRRGEGGGPPTASIGDRGGAVARAEGRATAEARDDGRAAVEDGCPPDLPRDFVVNLQPPPP